ncbi:MAG: hypothetical protein CVU90_02185 [Firmicutes bacterium HGW-Firmicutes-15]|nr:MAG: hypothetical protein CVU90_02185 [Firmicutes bacterium HGW-Firmicutes-15]
MSLLTREDLTTLMEKRDDICISIYMPTFRAGADIRQGRIRLKNLVSEAQARLISSGMRSSEAKHLLEPVQGLVLDNQFWQQQRDGLAIFLSSDIFYYYYLPVRVDEFVQIAKRFHLKPLLPLLSGDGLFYVLALSQNAVRVLRCTRASVVEVELDSIPHSLAEALKYDDYDDPERQVQYHSTNLAGTNNKAEAGIFHGHGVGSDDTKPNILRYFQLIDRGLHDLLREEKAPLVLVGVEFLFSIYREANTYAYLADEGVPGNPEELCAEDLQTLAWPLVEHYFHKAEQEAITYYGPFKGTGLTTHDISKAAPAAYNGQVEILFLADGAKQWGRFDPLINDVHIHQEAELDDEDLFDFTAIQTIINGGTVYVVEADRVPDGESLAALLRY